MEGPCSEFPRPVSPKRMIVIIRLFEEPVSHEDMHTGPGVFCLEKRKPRYMRTVTDTKAVFK